MMRPNRTRPSGLSIDHDGQNNDQQHHRQYDQQAKRLAPRILLIPIRTPQLEIRAPRVRRRVAHIHLDRVQHGALLVHNVRHVPEQLVQLPDALLDVPNLAFSLDDERFLEVDFVLRCKAQLVLFLYLLLLLVGVVGIAREIRRVAGVVESGARGGSGSTLLLQGQALDGLEFRARGLEFARELLLGVFLGGLLSG